MRTRTEGRWVEQEPYYLGSICHSKSPISLGSILGPLILATPKSKAFPAFRKGPTLDEALGHNTGTSQRCNRPVLTWYRSGLCNYQLYDSIFLSYLYVCMYVCMYIYTYMYVCIYVSISIYTYKASSTSNILQNDVGNLLGEDSFWPWLVPSPRKDVRQRRGLKHTSAGFMLVW